MANNLIFDSNMNRVNVGSSKELRRRIKSSKNELKEGIYHFYHKGSKYNSYRFSIEYKYETIGKNIKIVGRQFQKQ